MSIFENSFKDKNGITKLRDEFIKFAHRHTYSFGGRAFAQPFYNNDC